MTLAFVSFSVFVPDVYLTDFQYPTQLYIPKLTTTKLGGLSVNMCKFFHRNFFFILFHHCFTAKLI